MILPLTTDECKPDYRDDILPLNATCAEPEVDTVIALGGKDRSVSIRVGVSYREARGFYTISSDGSGRVVIDYAFTLRRDINPRQWGIVLYAPRQFDRLVWERKGQWTTYPADHIGRVSGEAHAHPILRPAGIELLRQPTLAWSRDAMELGENDFRSTKRDVTSASLNGHSGEVIELLCEAPRSIRAFVDGNRIGFLVTGFTTGGGEGFFAPHYASERRPLKEGETISDRVVFDLHVSK